MEITIRSSKILKQGERKDGTPYTWLAVIAEGTGVEYTTFDKKANAGAGAVLDIGEPIIKEGKHSFKECKVISEAPVSTGNGGNGNQMSKEEWADKDRLQLDAKFRNTALMTAGEKCEPGMQTVETADLYYRWLIGNLDVKNISILKQTMKPSVKTEETKTTVTEPIFEPEESILNIQELFAWLVEKNSWKNADFARSWIRNDFKDITDKMIDEEPGRVQAIIAKEKSWTV
ncbi:hypothetical protein LCGC14_0420320 [marine sediment metagenome]|uniref:Uncharacterized protein n=1 Tax=marine sediment metagenome TaxID=412755 RepID=A0A0F9W074_9ZZZZ